MALGYLDALPIEKGSRRTCHGNRRPVGDPTLSKDDKIENVRVRAERTVAKRGTRNSEFQRGMLLDADVDVQIQKVIEEAKKDPRTAYEDAMSLPLRRALGPSCPRASALKYVALGSAKQNAMLARTAMSEARRLLQDIDPSRQAVVLAEVPDFYLSLGDEDGARDAIRDQMKLAEKLYAIDSDADDPNLAFKGAWPSTYAWKNCLHQATKISPAFAEELLAEIADPNIAGLQRVMYANSLLRAEKSSVAVVEWHKGGRHSGIFMSQ